MPNFIDVNANALIAFGLIMNAFILALLFFYKDSRQPQNLPPQNPKSQ